MVKNINSTVSKFDDYRMRVLILASGDLWAGAEVMVYQLVCGLKEFDSMEIQVVLFNDGRLAEKLKNNRVDVRILNEAQQSIPILVKKLYTLVKEFSPHIIHSHRYKENLLAWLVTRAMRRIRLVATQHGMPETAGEKQTYKGSLRSGLFFYLLSLGFQKTIVVSQEMRSLLLGKYGFSKKKLEVIHNGILLPPEFEKTVSGSYLVGSAGRLFPVKGYDFFIEVAVKVIRMNEHVQFVIAGDGPEQKRLERMIGDFGLRNQFTLIGHVDDMSGFYGDLDVYVNTSVHEGIPMSVLEAMGHYLPVIVPNVGGFPEIVEDGENGYLVVERDADLFAQKILGLVDSDRRKKMANSARKRVEKNFSRNTMAEKYYQLYGKLFS